MARNNRLFNPIYSYFNMDFVQDAPLSCKAAIAVVSSAWCHEEVWKLYNPSLSGYCQQKWQNTEEKIMKTLYSLPVTPYAKQQLINFTHPVGMQLQRWLVNHSYLNVNDFNLPSVLCWNSHGVIMLKETAGKIIADGNVGLMNCFALACIYCIEEHVYRLWPILENDIRTNLPPKGPHEVLFWVYYLMDRMEELNDIIGFATRVPDPFHLAFSLAVQSTNGIFADHFLEKVGADKYRLIQKTCRFIIFNRVRFSYAMIPHLFPKLDISDQNLLLSYNPDPILLEFLNWPFHTLFLDAANKSWEDIQPKKYYFMLDRIAHLVWEYNQNPVFVEIFEDFWLRKCKPCSRDYVIQMCLKGTFLSRLFSRDKMEHVIKLILQKATVHEKKDIILCLNGIQTLDYLISRRRWDSIALFVHECLPVDETELLIEVYLNHSKVRSPLVVIKDEEKNYFLTILKYYKVGKIAKFYVR